MASSTFGQTLHRDVEEEELVMGRATMKRNSQSIIDGFGSPPSGSSWQSAPPPHAAGKENFGSGKHLAPSVARIHLGPAQLSGAGAPSAVAPSGHNLPTGSKPKWQINDEQMHQPWGACHPPCPAASPRHAHNQPATCHPRLMYARARVPFSCVCVQVPCCAACRDDTEAITCPHALCTPRWPEVPFCVGYGVPLLLPYVPPAAPLAVVGRLWFWSLV